MLYVLYCSYLYLCYMYIFGHVQTTYMQFLDMQNKQYKYFMPRGTNFIINPRPLPDSCIQLVVIYSGLQKSKTTVNN